MSNTAGQYTTSWIKGQIWGKKYRQKHTPSSIAVFSFVFLLALWRSGKIIRPFQNLTVLFVNYNLMKWNDGTIEHSRFCSSELVFDLIWRIMTRWVFSLERGCTLYEEICALERFGLKRQERRLLAYKQCRTQQKRGKMTKHFISITFYHIHYIS